jgi:oxygen-independent coproporphyrinogen-3 oxidase
LAGQSPVFESETLCPESRARERLVFALRRLAGVERAAFAVATGFSLDDLGATALRRYVSQGLLADDGARVRLTRRGLMVSDALWPDLLVPSAPPRLAASRS